MSTEEAPPPASSRPTIWIISKRNWSARSSPSPKRKPAESTKPSYKSWRNFPYIPIWSITKRSKFQARETSISSWSSATGVIWTNICSTASTTSQKKRYGSSWSNFAKGTKCYTNTLSYIAISNLKTYWSIMEISRSLILASRRSLSILKKCKICQ